MRIMLVGAAGQMARAIQADAEHFKRHEIIGFTRPQLDITNASDVERAMAAASAEAGLRL